MCARIFPTKDETTINLKEAHQIDKSSGYGKNMKQIAFYNTCHISNYKIASNKKHFHLN